LKWKYKNIEIAPEVEELVGSKIVAQILANRGVDTFKKAAYFLNPEKIVPQSPFVFSDMQKSVERIAKAIETAQKIAIYGDFDCDGVTSTALLYKTLKYLGANVIYYMPDRAQEGHGLNSKAIVQLISKHSIKLIITVDNGISNLAEIKLAQGFGTDVIITDHHEAPPELPCAFAIINPKAPDALDEKLSIEEMSDLQNLAGVGVAYKLAQALLAHYKKEDFADEIIHLVSIGTIADVVPLIGENRHYVRKGLEVLALKQPSGLIKLIKSAGADISKITSETIAFSVAPRINAAGRLDNAGLAVEFFAEEDDEKLDSYVKQLNNHNQNRQQLCDTTFMEAEFKIKEEINLNINKGIVLYDENWHAGVIGIVASKLVEKYHRPAFLITYNKEKNQARCSARGVEGFHLYETLKELTDILGHFGGHALAAGFSLDLNTIKINEFIKILNNTINARLSENPLQSFLNIDAEVNPEDVNLDLINKLSMLSPFGSANPSPVFSLSSLQLKDFKTMGSSANHLKMFFSTEEKVVFEAVWWNRNTIEAQVLEKIDVVFCPKANFFNGKSTIQLELKDIRRIADEEEPVENIPELFPSSLTWLDHRKKINIFKAVNNYLKTTSDEIAVFVENREIVKILEEYSEITSRITDRLNVSKVDEVMLFDYPADSIILQSIIEMAEPKKIHVMPFTLKTISLPVVIKNVSGMLKYAHAQKDGMIYIDEIASKLSVSGKLLACCIKLLDNSSIIEITNMNDELCEFKFLQGKELNLLMNLPEYKELERNLEEIQKFRHDLCHDEILKLQNLFIY
jgi:single-stranded-DNA-specific exonuclease